MYEYLAPFFSACNLWYRLGYGCSKNDRFGVGEPYSSRLTGYCHQCPFEPIRRVQDDAYLVSNVLLKHMEYCGRETLLRHVDRKTPYLLIVRYYWSNTDIYCTNGVIWFDQFLY